MAMINFGYATDIMVTLGQSKYHSFIPNKEEMLHSKNLVHGAILIKALVSLLKQLWISFVYILNLDVEF